MNRVIKAIVWILFCVAACQAACATVGGAVKSCEPTTAQETQLLTAASNPDELAALALIDALPFGVCIIQKLADKFISSHQPPPAAPADAGSVTADLAQAASVDAIRLRNLMDWRAEHP